MERIPEILSPIENTDKKSPCIFKIEISASEYNILTKKIEFFQVPIRTYMYFDTSELSEDAQLFQKNIRLRIKIKGDKRFLELKKRGDIKCEVFQTLSIEEFQKIIMGTLPEGNVKKKLTELGAIFPLKLIDTIKSEHQKAEFHDGRLILEKTTSSRSHGVGFQVEFRSEKSFNVDEVNKLIVKELGISNTEKDKTKLQKFWENR